MTTGSRATMTFVVVDHVPAGAFVDAASAVAFALERQQESGGVFRMAVVTGDADQGDDGTWRGSAATQGAQLSALAHPGQILVSAATFAVVGDGLPAATVLRDLGGDRSGTGGRSSRVYQLCHPDLAQDFPPLPSPRRAAHNLPPQLTSFVGRVDELRAVEELWADHPIVTLVGPGGSGKTRLAIEMGKLWLHATERAVWFVDLAGVTEPSLVALTVAGALGIVPQPLQPAADAIAAEFGGDPALLILDNCEHVVSETAALATVLVAACRGVRILATSREPLGVRGELEHAVPPLALPQDASDGECESVTLFVERATAVRPTFTLDEPTLAAVSDICRRLDGLPLAIELAAARCRSMAPREIAEQLRDRFSLLATTQRDAPARHRTLEESIRWGFELLSEPERVLLQRLSVFPGTFGLAAAEAVGTAGDVDRWQVLDLITTLVSRSLLHPEDAAGRTRYRLLETVRAFAAARLEEAGETTACRDRHLRYATEFFGALEAAASAHASGQALVTLMEEADDLRAALAWARASGQRNAAAHLFAATGAFWNLVSPAEGQRWGAYVAESYVASARDHAQALLWATFCAWVVGDIPAANRFTDQARLLGEELDDPLIAAHVANSEGRQLLVQGDAAAIDRFDEGARLAAPLGQSLVSVGCLTQAGVALSFAGRIPEARERVERALHECRARDDHVFLGLALDVKAWTAMLGGDFSGARDAVAAQPDTRWSTATRAVARGMVDLIDAWMLSADGRHEEAMTVLADRVAEARRFQFVAMAAFAGWLPAWLGWRAGQPPDLEAMAESELVMATSGFAFGQPMLNAMRAEHALVHDVDGATAYLLRAEEVQAAPLARLFAPLVRNTAARVALKRGDARAADLAAYESLIAFNTAGMRWGIPEALETLAACAAARDRAEHGARLVGAASGVRAAVGWQPGVAEQAAVAALVDTLRGSLSGDAFDIAAGEGRAMTQDQAITYATRGRGERASRGFGWEGLTPAERDVTRLAAQGLRNAEIAEQLLVTPATIKTHLAHAFAKLGVRSRAELAHVHRRNE